MRPAWLVALIAAMGLSACASSPTGDGSPQALATIARTPVPTATTDAAPGPAEDLVRRDSQGAVEFVVVPLNLNGPGDTLVFSVTMDTHSVDLGWDLAAGSTLETDTGLQVEAVDWPVGGGHHYAGNLVFPRLTSDSEDLLTAGALRLVIRSTDIPERVFSWEIVP